MISFLFLFFIHTLWKIFKFKISWVRLKRDGGQIYIKSAASNLLKYLIT